MMMWLIDAIVPGGGGGGGGVGGGGGEGGLVGGGFPVPGFGVLELAPQPEVSTTKKAQSVNCNSQKARARLDTTAFPFADAWKQQLCRGLQVCRILHVMFRISRQSSGHPDLGRVRVAGCRGAKGSLEMQPTGELLTKTTQPERCLLRLSFVGEKSALYILC
jgi:hypothetical protein